MIKLIKGKVKVTFKYFSNSLYGFNKLVDPNIGCRRTKVPVKRLGDKIICYS